MKTIKLTQGQIAIVDDEDYEELAKHKWFAHKRGNTFYAARNIRVGGERFAIQMHRILLRAKPHEHVDHRDRNGLNNTRENIRIATRSENQGNARRRMDNTSRFKGVHFHPQNKRWQARIRVNGKRRSLGLYDTPEEAHAAYCIAAVQMQKDFARFQ